MRLYRQGVKGISTGSARIDGSESGHAIPDAVWTGLLALFIVALLGYFGLLGWR